jgi:hypothetical protein
MSSAAANGAPVHGTGATNKVSIRVEVSRFDQYLFWRHVELKYWEGQRVPTIGELQSMTREEIITIYDRVNSGRAIGVGSYGAIDPDILLRELARRDTVEASSRAENLTLAIKDLTGRLLLFTIGIYLLTAVSIGILIADVVHR